MGTGYTRNDSSNNIADGNVINASDLDGEYDAIESAFGTSGHTHDGTSGEGGPVTVLGPVQDFVASASEIKPKTDNTLDIGTSSLEFKNLYLDGLAYIDGLGETMLVSGSSSIQFRDTAISINSSTDGQLDIDADTEIEITSPTIDINASTVVNISTDLIVGDDLTLQSDAAVLNFGADSDVSLTHVADTGLLLNAGSAIQFRDAALAINSSADGQLDIIADTQLEITTPTLELNSDAQIIAIGADGDVTVTHEADTGLKMKAASGFELNLQTGDTSVESGNVLGKITFNAPSESSGSDALLDGAAIEAVAEGTFSSTVNTTKLSFKTGASEAATEKMSLSSAGALSVTGVVTANAGVVVDEMTIDGDTVTATDDFTIDAVGDIFLDADGGDINFQDGGTTFGFMAKTNDNLLFGNSIQDGDVLIRGNDADGGNFTALTFDMSDQGTATFNHDVKMGDLCYLLLGAGNDLELVGDGTNGKISAANGNLTLDVAGDIELNADGNEITFKHGSDLRYEFKLDSTPEMNVTGGNFTIQNQTDDGDILFAGSDAGSGITALTLDMSNAGAATFNHLVAAGSNGGFYLIQDSSESLIRSETQPIILQTYASSAWGDRLTITTDYITVATGTDLVTDTAAGTSNVRIGFQAGDSIVASNAGVNNVCIGSNAGTALDSGDSNIAIGTDALLAEDDHANNVAVGQFALKAQDAGTDAYNVGIGYYAGTALSTGSASTFVGGLAGGVGVITGAGNVGVGYRAAEDLTSGFHNTFVGQQAGTATTVGYESVGIGYRALFTNTRGRHIVAIGAQALDIAEPDSDTSTYNVAVGAYAGLANTTGALNTLIGGFAGRSNSSAGNNVMVGYASGYYNTTGAANTFIGVQAAQGLDATKLTGDNHICIGYKAGFLLQGASGENTIIGSLAGDALATGSSNVIVGYEAMSTADGSETGNVAIGVNALHDLNQDGTTENTAVGHKAGKDVTTGVSNTYVGFESGNNNGGTGSCAGNVAVGRLAGYSLTTGGFNVLLGYNAGDLVDTGIGNVCIGFDTGSNVVNLTSGDYNIMIGHKVRGENTGDNSITIGHDIGGNPNDFTFGKASNVVHNDFDTDANWSQSSDERLKKNITDQKLGLDFINDLRTVKYNWKPSTELDDKDTELNHLRLDKESNSVDHEDFDGTVVNNMNTTATMHNFVAQEVKTALDKAGVSDFSGWSEDRYGVQQVSREMFIIPLVKAMQELSAKVTSLEAEVTKLKGE